MTTLRILSFLGRAALPHYTGVGAHVAGALGVPASPVEEPGLERLADALREGTALLFLCGLPYVRARAAGADLEAVAAPLPTGEAGPVYGADLVVREGLAADVDVALDAPRVGVNGRDSLSGWVLPRHGIRALGRDPDAVRWVVTGSHSTSLALLATGELDAAPIDSTVLGLERGLDPAVAALRVAARLGEAPVPPVCVAGGDAGLARAVQAALVALADAELLARGRVRGYVATDDAAYDPVRRLDAEDAVGRG